MKDKMCLSFGEVKIEVKFEEDSQRFRVGVPYCCYLVPISRWYSSYSDAVSFIEGMVAGLELAQHGLELLVTDANIRYHDALSEAAKHARHYNIDADLQRICNG